MRSRLLRARSNVFCTVSASSRTPRRCCLLHGDWVEEAASGDARSSLGLGPASSWRGGKGGRRSRRRTHEKEKKTTATTKSASTPCHSSLSMSRHSSIDGGRLAHQSSRGAGPILAACAVISIERGGALRRLCASLYENISSSVCSNLETSVVSWSRALQSRASVARSSRFLILFTTWKMMGTKGHQFGTDKTPAMGVS